MNDSIDLAIVIPCYKSRYLYESLTSLSCQTVKNFNLYIGDDNSPENLYSIIKPFEQKLKIKYHKYESNIGPKNLTDHWNRCLQLINDEKWVWLFSDDDIADPECVERFYEEINKDNGWFDAYRFNTKMIDKNGDIIVEGYLSPEIEDTYEMAALLLQGKRSNSIVDHIYKVSEIKKKGGFIYTSYAQGADWATSIFYSYPKGLRTINGANVSWRLSDVNITGTVHKVDELNDRIKGHLQFLEWVICFFTKHFQNEKVSEIKKYCEINFEMILEKHYKKLPLETFPYILRFYDLTSNSSISSFFKTIAIYVKFGIIKKIYARYRLQ